MQLSKCIRFLALDLIMAKFLDLIIRLRNG